MKRWFESLPIHSKLIAIVLAVTTVALLVAVSGLIAFDVARFRRTAVDDARALAQVIAENASAAIVFNDPDAARQMLASVAVRPVISRACIYRDNGTLLAQFARAADRSCPAMPADEIGWRFVASRVPVVRNDRIVGAIYVERALSDLPGRIIVTATAAMLMLLGASVLAFAVARRLQQVISRPIVSLATAARVIGRDALFEMPAIPALPDETGELVHAFSDMVQRLVSSNEALRLEVDERRRMQGEREALLAREREASRLKDEFLAAVSHELRTPLNAILGWTQVLASTKPNEQTVAKAIASLSRNAHAQQRVIEDLLDVSRIITGKLQLTLTAVDLRTALDSALEVIMPMAAAKGLQVHLEKPAIACVVQGDFDRIRQVFWNLLSNAVKFTPAGGEVTVSLAEYHQSFSVAVTDTGIGIAADFLPHVFERFRQADGSTTREQGGLGLGLAIVKELTELHGGTVLAASSGLGHGATFTVSFPQLIGNATDAPAISWQASSPVRLDHVEVVAADDNPDSLDIVTSALTNVGARVRSAISGKEALDEIQHTPPDVVLCDLAMPGMDGFEVLERVHQIEISIGRKIPVIAVTAYASANYRERCERAGFHGHVSKPYDTGELIREIAAILSRRQIEPSQR